jgi:hypothetical protein
MVERILIDKAYFVAPLAGVPDLHFEGHNEELDHGWHEFHGLEPTDNAPTDPQQRNIEELIIALRNACQE